MCVWFDLSEVNPQYINVLPVDSLIFCCAISITSNFLLRVGYREIVSRFLLFPSNLFPKQFPGHSILNPSPKF